jgi:hypothetical protein
VELSAQRSEELEDLSPHKEYSARRAARQADLQRLVPREKLLGFGRLAVFLAGLILVGFVFGVGGVSPVWLVLPLAAFVILLILYDRVTRAGRRAERAMAFYESALARLEDRWAGGGETGDRYLHPEHPNAADLDLFGSGSLFELLCTARTRTGQDTLAGWLLAPASAEEVRNRQAAVMDLRARLDLREELALLGATTPEGIDLGGLLHWGEAPPLLTSQGIRWAVLALTVIATLALIGWAFGFLARFWFLGAALVESAVAWSLYTRVRQILKPVERRAGDLAVFAGILARIEQEAFTAPRLQRLRAALDTAGMAPSRRIYQLINLIDWLNARRNQLFFPLALLWLWGTQMAFAIEAWRATCGRTIARWLTAVGEFEALSALAAYALENPGDAFPEIAEDGSCFAGVGLGHPLLPRARCVRNDVRLSGETRLLVVSGSNMSGKSTLLRTVGINTVLALAGAPVRASRLRLSTLVVGGTLRIQDSLQAGRSRFYAEITRLKQLLDLAKSAPPPLLFLLDEILHGTNSHDRRLGAEAVVRSLLGRGAIGLVTTHDLALTDLAGVLTPQAVNTHFADQIDGDQITFDYQMRPGVVQHGNALALMRAVGLEV